MGKLKLILVDDNVSFRKALKSLLEFEYDADIIGEASGGDEFLTLENSFTADIILMDIMMPGKDGIVTAKELLIEYPKLKIIAITGHTDLVYIYKLVCAGFKGCIFKNNLYSEIEVALREVSGGELYFPKEMSLMSFNEPPKPYFS
jgi:DNA-binding NarL/FixJ family response regulator